MANEMARKPEREKLEMNTRTPKKPGLFDNVGTNRQLGVHPMRDILDNDTEDQPVINLSETSSTSDTSISSSELKESSTPSTSTMPSTASNTGTPSQPSTTSNTSITKAIIPIAPVSNYTRLTNSTITHAIPEGFFKSGKSMQVYNVLYLLTRGAIVPKRKIQISRTELMKRSNVGSKVTIDSILADFVAKGVITNSFRYGAHSGNEIEVFIYEEFGTTNTSTPSITSPTRLSSSTHNLGQLDHPETSTPSTGPESITTGISDTPKTFFKDSFKSDDEKGIIEAIQRLNESAEKITGRELSPADYRSLPDLIQIILDETAIAAGRTGSISSFVKFATENLRRRLYKKPRQQKIPAGKSVGSEDSNVIDTALLEIVPLTEEKMLNVIDALRSSIKHNGEDSIEWAKENYTPEDWDSIKRAIKEGE